MAHIAKMQTASARVLRRVAALLACCALLCGVGLPLHSARAAEGEVEELALYLGHGQAATSFCAPNLLPGDCETATYAVQVSYRGTVAIQFCTDVLSGYETLAEVLQCTVVLRNTGEVLYSGLLRDMPDAVGTTLYSEKSTTDTLLYDISVLLDTDVDNTYSAQQLQADFRWWAETDAPAQAPGSSSSSTAQTPAQPDSSTGDEVAADAPVTPAQSAAAGAASGLLASSGAGQTPEDASSTAPEEVELPENNEVPKADGSGALTLPVSTWGRIAMAAGGALGLLALLFLFFILLKRREEDEDENEKT